MTFNIVDKRTNKYNVDVDVVFEPSCRDNIIEGASQAEEYNAWIVRKLYNTTLHDSLRYADSYNGPVTIFLYDAGSKPVG